MPEELAAVTVPSFLNAGLSVGILAMSRVKGVSSLSIDDFALAGLGRDRRDLRGELAAVDSAASARRTRLGGELVLGLAREAVLLRGGIGKTTHELPIPGALQAVVEHVIQHFLVAHAIAGAGLGQQVGRIGHRLDAAGDDHLAEPARIWSAASMTARMAEPHILLTVVAGVLGGIPAPKRRLTGRRLADARRTARSP